MANRICKCKLFDRIRFFVGKRIMKCKWTLLFFTAQTLTNDLIMIRLKLFEKFFENTQITRWTHTTLSDFLCLRQILLLSRRRSITFLLTEQSHEQSRKHVRNFSSSQRSASYLNNSSDFIRLFSNRQSFVSSMVDGFEEIEHDDFVVLSLARRFFNCVVAFWKRLKPAVDMIKQKTIFLTNARTRTYFAFLALTSTSIGFHCFTLSRNRRQRLWKIHAYTRSIYRVNSNRIGSFDGTFFSPSDLLQIPELTADFTRHRLYFDSDYSSQETFTVIQFQSFDVLSLSRPRGIFLRLLVVHILFDGISLYNSGILSVSCIEGRRSFFSDPLIFSCIVSASCQLSDFCWKSDQCPDDTKRKISARILSRSNETLHTHTRENVCLVFFFFFQAKWSRKGFTQTRWLINGLYVPFDSSLWFSFCV